MSEATKTERPRRPDGRWPGRVYHYNSRYKVVASPTIGKVRCFDVSLIKGNGAGGGFGEVVQTVRVWRGCAVGDGKAGNPYELAMAEAHKLRASLDAYVQYLRRG
jgi:hypothetical protein